MYNNMNNMNNINKYDLNTNWVLWCHSLTNNNWNTDSYNKIFNINNLYDYYSFIKNIDKNNYNDSMFFLMRENILPIWEDENNLNGCCLTIKIPNKNVKEEWDKLVLKCISETIHIDKEKYNNITGLSIIPKKEFNILKIWFKNNIENVENIDNIIKLYDPYIIKNNIKVKKNIY